MKKYRDEFPSPRLTGLGETILFSSVERLQRPPTGSKLVQTDFSRLTNKDSAIIRLLIAKRKTPDAVDTVGYFKGIKSNIIISFNIDVSPRKITAKNVSPTTTIFLVFIFNFFFRLLLTLSPVPKNRHRSSSCSLLCKCPCKTFGSLTISPQLHYRLSPPVNKDFHMQSMV